MGFSSDGGDIQERLMNTTQMWMVATLAADRIVRTYHRMYPNAEGVVCFTTGGGSTDTSFSRTGTSQQDMATILPTLLSNLLSTNASDSAPDPAMAASQRTFLSSLLNRDQNATPGRSTLDNTMAIDPTTFGGSPTLASIVGRNPYSTQFENDTESAFHQRSADALAQVQTGHEAVRGGQSRSGIAQGVMATRLGQDRGQEIRNAQSQDAGIVTGATQLTNMIEAARRGLQVGAQGQLGNQSVARTATTVDAARSVDSARGQHSAALDLASRLLGSRSNLVTDNLSGKGNQGTSSWGLNVLGGCCFIFLEALNGKLPAYVERARVDFHTPIRRRGYKWLSFFLVPAMQRSKLVRLAVNAFLVQPLLKWGAYYYKEEGTKARYRLLKPYVFLWFHTWHFLGLTFGRKVN